MYSVYDNETFFAQYAQMSRSQMGLSGAGEWSLMQKLLPEFKGKSVLDLGCGYGWHCKYAEGKGAKEVLGLDLSTKMIEEAKKRNPGEKITYRVSSLEEYDYPKEQWDVVISNLVLHYIQDLDGIFRKIYRTLKPGGILVFNIEHPVFTAGVGQDWIYGEDHTPLYWPVDDYYRPGKRSTNFLGCRVEKQHHTLTQILMGVKRSGFSLEAVEEAEPPREMMDLPGMADEMRRPMMLLVKGKKQPESVVFQKKEEKAAQEKGCDIRMATLEDAKALQAIYAPYVEQTAISLEYTAPTVEEFRERMVQILQRYPYLVAQRQGEIVGYAYAKPFHERAAFAWEVEATVYVRQDQKKTGIGKKLYENLERILAAQNIQGVNVSIAYPEVEDEYLTRNSVEFHHYMGYELAARFRNSGYKFGRWYDLVWMKKQIGTYEVQPPEVKSWQEVEFLP